MTEAQSKPPSAVISDISVRRFHAVMLFFFTSVSFCDGTKWIFLWNAELTIFLISLSFIWCTISVICSCRIGLIRWTSALQILQFVKVLWPQGSKIWAIMLLCVGKVDDDLRGKSKDWSTEIRGGQKKKGKLLCVCFWMPACATLHFCPCEVQSSEV